VERDRALAMVSALQLCVGVLSMSVALKRRLPYDLPLLHGQPEHVARDSMLVGTALSAPVVMLTVQGVAITRLYRNGGRGARLLVGVLGATTVGGYLGESLVRQRLRRSTCDPLETPLVTIGILVAGAVAALGLS
jgi:hypothetical protein